MSNKILALTTDGKMTYCTCPPESRGKGRCNHISHQYKEETPEDFANRISFYNSDKNEVFDTYEKFKEYEDKIDGALNKFVDNDYFYKFDVDTSELFGQRNALSEEMACLVESECKDFDYVDYEIVSITDKETNQSHICCKSKNFMPENGEFLSINQVLNLDDSFLVDYEEVDRNKQLNYIVNKLNEVYGLDKGQTRSAILKQISLDFIIMNNDRTLNNMGIVFDKNGKAIGVAPCFDNGSCITAYKEYDNYSIDDIYEDFNICTFGLSDDNEDYLDLIKSNDGPLLEINSKQLIKKIEKYSCKAYPKAIVERNKQIIINNLKKYKNILYKDIND